MHALGERFGGWFPLLLLTVLAAVTFWLDGAVQPPARSPNAARLGEPDYIVDGLAATRMDHEGRVKHTLRAQKMTHYPVEDMTVLVAPTFVTYADGSSPLTVTSRHARMSGNGDHVYFEDDVRVVRAPYGTRSALVLETNYLHVIPDKNLVKTDRPVSIRDATGVVFASGLELDSETRVLSLQGRVKGTFQSGRVSGAR